MARENMLAEGLLLLDAATSSCVLLGRLVRAEDDRCGHGSFYVFS